MKYELGMVDYNHTGRANCKAVITWELKDDRFSMSAEIWNPHQSDIYCGGQCVDTVAALFPHDDKAKRMVAVWERWHLNDRRAGSPAQEDWLRNNPIPKDEYAYPKSHYEVASRKLAEVGLNPDNSYIHNGKPYKYGSARIAETLPADVVAEIKSWEN